MDDDKKYGGFNSEDLFSFPEDDTVSDEQGEPSFSLHEFKKWLSKQKQPSEKREDSRKEELKEKFKSRFKEKLRKRRKKDD